MDIKHKAPHKVDCSVYLMRGFTKLSHKFLPIAVFREVPADSIPFMRGNGRAGE